MSTLTFDKIDKNGIEFYISNDGSKSGMSITGLAKCAGVPRKTLSGILNRLNTPGENNRIQRLEPFRGEIFISDTPGENNDGGAKIVSSEVCAEVITFYAFESQNLYNDIAKHTLAKFATKGIHSWIVEITEFAKEDKSDKILDALKILTDEISTLRTEQQEMIAEQRELKKITTKYDRVKNYTIVAFPGLNQMLGDIEDEDGLNQLPGIAEHGATLQEWLEAKGITLNHAQICKFGRLVADTYKSCSRELPKKGNKRKPNGKWTNNVTLYTQEHYPLLQMALEHFVSVN
jgi:hypothetical protein